MKLTGKEMEIMAVLWASEDPMTATEIIEASNNRTWKENSIYIIMNTLIKKGAVDFAHFKPTGTNNARTYTPIITSEECIVHHIDSVMGAGVRVDIPSLVKRLMKKDKEG